MAFYAIEKRKTTSGETRYNCRVRAKFNGKIIHNESKTFSKMSIADKWGRQRVEELEEELLKGKSKTVPLGVLLDMYTKSNELWGKTGRTKR